MANSSSQALKLRQTKKKKRKKKTQTKDIGQLNTIYGLGLDPGAQINE